MSLQKLVTEALLYPSILQQKFQLPTSSSQFKMPRGSLLMKLKTTGAPQIIHIKWLTKNHRNQGNHKATSWGKVQTPVSTLPQTTCSTNCQIIWMINNEIAKVIIFTWRRNTMQLGSAIPLDKEQIWTNHSIAESATKVFIQHRKRKFVNRKIRGKRLSWSLTMKMYNL